MILAFAASVHDPIEIATPNIDTLVPNGIILENCYVLPVHLQVCQFEFKGHEDILYIKVLGK